MVLISTKPSMLRVLLVPVGAFQADQVRSPGCPRPKMPAALMIQGPEIGHLLSKTLTWGNSELRKIANLDGFMSKLLPSSLDWLGPSHLIQNTHSNVFNSFQIPLASIKEIEMPLYQ